MPSWRVNLPTNQPTRQLIHNSTSISVCLLTKANNTSWATVYNLLLQNMLVNCLVQNSVLTIIGKWDKRAKLPLNSRWMPRQTRLPVLLTFAVWVIIIISDCLSFHLFRLSNIYSFCQEPVWMSRRNAVKTQARRLLYSIFIFSLKQHHSSSIDPSIVTSVYFCRYERFLKINLAERRKK